TGVQNLLFDATSVSKSYSFCQLSNFTSTDTQAILKASVKGCGFSNFVNFWEVDLSASLGTGNTLSGFRSEGFGGWNGGPGNNIYGISNFAQTTTINPDSSIVSDFLGNFPFKSAY